MLHVENTKRVGGVYVACYPLKHERGGEGGGGLGRGLPIEQTKGVGSLGRGQPVEKPRGGGGV